MHCTSPCRQTILKLDFRNNTSKSRTIYSCPYDADHCLTTTRISTKHLLKHCVTWIPITSLSYLAFIASQMKKLCLLLHKLRSWCYGYCRHASRLPRWSMRTCRILWNKLYIPTYACSPWCPPYQDHIPSGANGSHRRWLWIFGDWSLKFQLWCHSSNTHSDKYDIQKQLGASIHRHLQGYDFGGFLFQRQWHEEIILCLLLILLFVPQMVDIITWKSHGSWGPLCALIVGRFCRTVDAFLWKLNQCQGRRKLILVDMQPYEWTMMFLSPLLCPRHMTLNPTV
jgi:hypothetical protein